MRPKFLLNCVTFGTLYVTVFICPNPLLGQTQQQYPPKLFSSGVAANAQTAHGAPGVPSPEQTINLPQLPNNDSSRNFNQAAVQPSSWTTPTQLTATQVAQPPLSHGGMPQPTNLPHTANGASDQGTTHASFQAPSPAGSDSSLGTRTVLPLRPRTTAAEQTSERPKGGFLQMFMSVGSSLLVVIGLFLGVAWCYRRTGNTNLNLLPKHVVSVLGRSGLAPRQQLVLLRFGPKLVLVNLSQGDARTISEITDPIEVDRLAGLCESARPGSISESFRSVLFQTGKERA